MDRLNLPLASVLHKQVASMWLWFVLVSPLSGIHTGRLPGGFIPTAFADTDEGEGNAGGKLRRHSAEGFCVGKRVRK